MKSLILKDFYNISHNAKSMLLILLFLAFVFIPFSGPENYIFVAAILCGMMTVTTFSFDENSKWTRYAMITPVSKKDLVAGKFLVQLSFSAIGALAGLLIGTVGGLFAGKITFRAVNILNLSGISLTALVISMVFGSMSIPLLFKFGAEKGRMLTLISVLIPVGICFGIYEILLAAGVIFTDQLIFFLLCCSPVIALIWSYAMYRISCRIFSKQDL